MSISSTISTPSSATKTEWSAGIEVAQDHLQALRGWLSRLEEIKEQAEELVKDKIREKEPELARA